MADLKGQIAVITGAGKGIGRGIALSVSKAGALVVCMSRTKSDLQETVKLIKAQGGKADYRVVDVTDADVVGAATDSVVKQYGKIDLWVNNAGRNKAIGQTWDIEPSEWKFEVELNLFGVFVGTRAALRVMTKQNSGRVVNIAGGGTTTPMAFGSAYSASKTAVARFTETIAAELQAGNYDVTVFSLNPGLVKTALTDNVATSEAGKKYYPGIADMLAKGEATVPPSMAGDATVCLGSGMMDAYTGKLVDVFTDFDALSKISADDIKEDIFTLRLVN